MKTMCQPVITMAFVATHALGNMMHGWAHDVLMQLDNRTSCAQLHELPQGHCGDNQ